jgi:hypothetical protein
VEFVEAHLLSFCDEGEFSCDKGDVDPGEGRRVVGGVAVGIDFAGVQRRLRVDGFQPSWDEESEASPSRRVKTSSQRSMAASQDLCCGLVPVIGRQLRGISWLSVVGE